tara:strand:+ start:322 stop:468 length:147 start_codon:yes stop_codon:yes gene_type:complete
MAQTIFPKIRIKDINLIKSDQKEEKVTNNKITLSKLNWFKGSRERRLN